MSGVTRGGAPGVATLRLLSAPEFDSSSSLVCAIDEITSIRVVFSLDGLHQLEITAPEDAEWLEEVNARKVVWLLPEGSTDMDDVTEWYVSRDQIARDGGSGEVVVTCDPIYTILGDVGIIEDTSTGGVTYTNLGGVNLSARNYLATYVVPQLTAKSIDWIDVGTTDPDLQFDLDWDGITPLALVRRVEGETEAEFDFRRDSANSRYLLDILTEINASLAVVRLTEGVNVLEFVRERSRETLFTVIRPVGGLPSGAEQRADIGFASWEITDITSLTITAQAHNGGSGPVAENDQHIGLYVEAPDGTFLEIDDSEAPDKLTLASVTGLSVGDDIMIVADSSGTLLTELESPSGLSSFGRVQGKVDSEVRGERNWARNPFYTDWTASPIPQAYPAQADGAQNSVTSVDLKNLPAGLEIKAGDVLFGPTSTTVVIEITGDATVAGDGTVTVTTDLSRDYADDDALLVYNVAGREPDHHQRLHQTSTGHVTGPFQHSKSASEEISAQADGAQNFGSSSLWELDLKNITEGKVIEPGDIVGTGWALSEATVAGDGLATVTVYEPTNVTDGLAVTITKPDLGGQDTGQLAAFIVNRSSSSAQTPAFATDAFTLREVEGATQAWLSVRFRAMAIASGVQWESGGTIVPPEWKLVKNSDDSVLATVTDDDWTAAALGDQITRTLRVAHTVTTTEAVRLEFRLPVASGALITQPPFLYIEAVQLHLGMQNDAPFVEGSHATRMFQNGNVTLLAHAQWPAVYTATSTELIDEWGIDPASPALELGGTLRVTIDSLDLSLLLRVVGVEFNPFDAAEKRLTLDTLPELLTKQTARDRRRAQFVDVKVEVDASGAGRTTVLTSDDPPRKEGVRRAIVPPGSSPPSGSVPITPVDNEEE